MAIPLYIVNTRVRELRPYALIPEHATVKINQKEKPWDAPARIKQESLRRLGSASV